MPRRRRHADDLRPLALALRYPSQEFVRGNRRACSYSLISQICGISISSARRLCLEAISAPLHSALKRRVLDRKRGQQAATVSSRNQKLTAAHRRYLTRPAILRGWVGKSLAERCALFHRAFPELHISPSTMSRVYRSAGIKKKAIKITKIPTQSQKSKIEGERRAAVAAIRDIQQRGLELVYIDEMCTTVRTIPRTEWAAKGDSVRLDLQQLSRKTIATVAAISSTGGVLLASNYDRSVDTQKFGAFIRALADIRKGKRWCLFMDRLSVHRSKRSLELMADRGFEVIFNASYSPDFNPIEGVFSLVKQQIKKERLALAVRGEKENLNRIVEASFGGIQIEKIQGFITRSWSLMSQAS